jgi:twitching motility protein PilT
MRDLETIRIALTVAETGHLVFATLHTNDTAQALDRIVDVFPAEQQQQIRIQLANSLQAVYYQQLLPKIGGGRVAAFEILLANHAVRNLVKEGKSAQIRNVIVTGLKEGMQTLEVSISELIERGVIEPSVGLTKSMFPGEIRMPVTVPAAQPEMVATNGARSGGRRNR